MMHPSQRFEASNWEVGRNAAVLAVAGSVGYALVESTPKGSTLGAVGGLLTLFGFLVLFPWLLEAINRVSIWWKTRGYEVDR